MKRILSLAVCWLVLSLVFGFVGANYIYSTDTQEAELQIERDALTLKQLVNSGQWEEPLEADQRWKELEQKLQLAAILVENQEQVDSPASDRTAWSRAAMVGRRLTHSTPINESSQILQITRVIADSVLMRGWWLAWLSLNVTAVALTILGIRAVRKESQNYMSQLLPWIEATETPASSQTDSLLPKAVERSGTVATAMQRVRKHVNRAFQEQKAANARGELVLGNLREGVLAVDAEARVLLANVSFCKLLNLHQEPALHRPMLEVVRIPAISSMVRNVMQGQEALEQDLEVGNPPSYLTVTARTLPMRKGPPGVLVTVRDETMVKRVELIRREFVANASHELKTPLAAIRAYAESLQLGALDNRETASAFVNNIITQADRLNNLVQGMLQLSRAEIGGVLNYQEFDAIEALRPCLSGSEALAGQKGIKLHVETPDHPVLLESDKDSFQTIASNLFSNATRYTDNGGEVFVRLFERQDQAEADKQNIVLEVEDTGVGMKQEDLERVFERFFRVQRDRSADTGGTGLGLSMVKHLVQALDGSVSATSEVGKGSKFVVQLPVKRKLS